MRFSAVLAYGSPLLMSAAWISGPLSTAGAVVHAPRVRLAAQPTQSSSGFGWQSSNWSGYAITGGPYHAITGSWVVPTVSRTFRSTYSSAWIGIDGFNNQSLIQTGTEQDFVRGHARYSAWWEILPAASTTIPMAVGPGDLMSASIQYQGSGNWLISIRDVTRDESFSTVQAYNGPLTSAEWILEAPKVGGRVAPLAHYGQTVMNPGTVNAQNPGLIVHDGGVMVQHFQQVSTPSVPDADTDGFNVAYGASSPAAPSS